MRTAGHKQIIISADDFGLSPAVNEAIEHAHQAGILSTASLMVAGDAAQDAIQRACRNPGLRVGLHLVTIEGPATLPPARIGRLVGSDGHFPSDQLGLGIRYFFDPRVRAQLWAEIQAQFAAFSATGLKLDHANAHKHMHLHPTVGRMLIRAGQPYGLNAVRVPAEPPAILQECGLAPSQGDRILYKWSGLLRHQIRKAGMRANDHAFGIAWSGHMTAQHLKTLAPHLPDGLSEIYFHPATTQDALLHRLMPDYEHRAEYEALVDPDIRRVFADRAEYTTWN